MHETGIITQEHTVWCCRSRRLSGMPFKAASTIGSPYGCHSHFGHAGGKRETIAIARRQGWILTKDFGWLCPPCAAAYRVWIKEASHGV
jgi:hypothetical protein